jgi:two-component system sensor histidine kinase UhpB
MIDFFEFSNEMLCVANQDGYFTRVNPAWTRTLGWSAEEMTSRPYIEFVHPDDLEATIQEAKALQSGRHETIWFENRYRGMDGSYRWLAWRVSVVAESNELVCSARDITEHKMVEISLREAEERFRVFMDNSPALAWAKDEQGRYVYLNAAYERQMQVRLADWLGRTDFDVWPHEVAEVFWANDQKVLANGTPIHVVESASTLANEHEHWLITKFLIQDSRNRRFVGGVGIDISDLKRTEQSLRDEQDLLVNLIEVQENEKRFLCNEFHDGLIQYSVGSVMLLESCRSDPQSPDNLAKLEVVIDKLRRGIDDGRRAIRGIRPAVLDDSGLHAAIDDLVGQFANSGILVKSQCDPQIGRLPNSIQTTIYRVVQESLNNAKKHSGTDVVRITLAQTDGHLQLEVRDFGMGFDVESARERGFGLRGMIERVRLLGGECVIQSEPDAGTRIAVRLPIPKQVQAT